MLCIRPVGCMQILYINRRMGLTGPRRALALLYSALLCSALLTLLACCSSIIATCRKHKPRAGGEQEGSRAARSQSQTSQIKAAGYTIQQKIEKKLKKSPSQAKQFVEWVTNWSKYRKYRTARLRPRRTSRSSFGPRLSLCWGWCCYDLMSLHQVTVMMEVHRERRAY